MTTFKKRVRIMFTTNAVINTHQQANAEMNSFLQSALNDVNSHDMPRIPVKEHRKRFMNSINSPNIIYLNYFTQYK